MTTSADVARAAGVSRATVSYVLNNRPDKKISETTRRTVLAAADELGYQASPAARALANGRGDAILLLVPDWNLDGEMGLLLNEIGLLLSGMGRPCLRFEGPQWQGDLAGVLTTVSCAALVTFEPLLDQDALAAHRAGVPEIASHLLERRDGPQTTSIHQEDVVKLQMEHLIERGFDQLVYAVPGDSSSIPFRRARVEAFGALSRQLGLEGVDVSVLPENLNETVDVVRSWLQTGKRAGVVAWSDDTAAQVLAAASAASIDVPEALGVVGVDNRPWAEWLRPSLSSVAFNLRGEALRIAMRVGEALKLGHVVPPEQLRGPFVRLVQRESS